MAIRNIYKVGEECLTKKCKVVTEFNEKLWQLLDDMTDTLHEANGAGLAAPQVGILKRVVVIDVGEGPIELINPKITKKSGEVKDVEGCLSVPGKWGYVIRPKKVTAVAQDRNGNEFTVKGEDLLARALCHELDHLDGILYTSHVIEYVDLEEEEK